MSHPVHFVGAGPGAEDLITLRGADLLARADTVLYAGSLVNPALLRRCKPNCAIHDSASMNLDAQVALMAEAVAAGNLVVRLHTGEPSVYGAIGEQMDALRSQGVDCVVTPGVSSVFAAAAAVGCELTRPGLSQSVVLTRTPGRTPMPAGETPAAFARTGATLAFFLSVGKLDTLTTELQDEGGLAPQTPTAVVYRASWPDEVVVRGTLADITEKVRTAGLQRQALILVGPALSPELAAEPSRLYDKTFAHGYRNTLPGEQFEGRCSIWAFTERGLETARTLCVGLAESAGQKPVVFGSEHRVRDDEQPLTPGGFEAALGSRWRDFDAHVVVGATGIAVRAIAPHLEHKSIDPAVLCCPDSGAFALPLVSGHLGGANRLARRVARILGGEALVSTATDLRGLPAFDEAAAREGACVLNPEALRRCNAALLDGTRVDFVGPQAVYARYFADCAHVRQCGDAQSAGSPAVFWLDGATPLPAHVRSPEHADDLIIRERTVVLGVGCRKGADPEALRTAACDLLLRYGIPVSRLAALATCSLKAHEPALTALAAHLDVPLRHFPEDELKSVATPTPSSRVNAKVGTPSVAEAAALRALADLADCTDFGPQTALTTLGPQAALATLGPQAALLAPKQSLGIMTFALAACAPLPRAGASERFAGAVTVVGLGSGAARHITPEVREALEHCDHLAGYSGYLDLIRPLTRGKTLIETPMRGEVARCRAALEAALAGHAVCLVCSGDPGVLAMAGLIYELRRHEPRYAPVPVSVLPGITAANLAAAALGAPLQNGFCLVSLSDLLVPADEVRRNVDAAARSALPLVLYNPAGRKRRTLLEESLDMLLVRRGPDTPAALVREAGRPGEQRWLGSLKNLPRERVDMSTLLVIGGPRTQVHHGLMFEERGYLKENS